MKNVWKSVDAVFGYAGVFETAPPAERMQVAIETAKVLGRRNVIDPVRRSWHRLGGAGRVIARLEQVGAPSDGTGWYRLPKMDYQALHDIQRPHGGWVQLWQDELLLIDSAGQVIGCAHEDQNETHIQLLADA